MYEEFYGLTERPFQLTPDPAFYFESITHKKALSYLGYGLNQGEGFVVITGEVGAGKSTLVAHLKQKLDDRRMTVGEVVTSALDGEEMIHVAARSFGLDVEGGDKASALAAIELFLHEEARGGRRVLLIVDEAQNLSIGALEELRMLSNFQLGSHPLLQTLLLGQPEFKHLLAQSDELEQLRQRVIAAHHLEPMQPGEMEPYVTHRLEHVGWTGNPEFASAIWPRLHKATLGIPRKVNQVMNRLLLMGSLEEQSMLEVDMLDAVIEEMSGDASPEVQEAPQRARPDRNLPASDAIAKARTESAPAMTQADTAARKKGLLDHQIEAIEGAFAQRDKHMAALRREVEKLAAAKDSGGALPEDIDQRLSAIEQRLDDQERSLRHVLTMMIDYFESTGTREAA
ncbi:XrtA/PEP-CTERM system-associated ATPase [Qipengyuania nanhaisediminis]|uniref:Putative secretion ATPase, PEP-CTERM locus subfamily n=1 Tax=Qipengyuania nanhaisediminis TaxID=604088 RepID=A0A1I5MQ62_9SPHN|nr:XrtA/PEP-CTERM system-associated ATPase [Qipengyuania nanhaisediminis]SFP11680.1 putative secretion ATPase, PEP-CTERM locus subfamily [Qipengyuania nanhaisediminis]